MMKKGWMIALVFALMLPLRSVWAENKAAPSNPILITAYRQVGWGDSIQIGYVDDAGGLWFLEGYDHDLNWPYKAEDQLTWLASRKDFSLMGNLNDDDLFVLKSLVQCVKDQGSDRVPAANDAGTEQSYAVLYSKDQTELILLGMSGDDRFENTDASAQALYVFLRKAFPRVTSYDGNPLMGPVGFQPTPLMDFCGYTGISLTNLRVERTDVDCETGTESVLLSSQEADTIRQTILQSNVIGKHSCIVTTGGSSLYSFVGDDGKTVAEFEFYHGLLVMKDGMYSIADNAVCFSEK